MRRVLSAAYRSIVPNSVRGPIFRLRSWRRGVLNRFWNNWADQPLGEPLDASQLTARRRRYRYVRGLLTWRSRRRYRRDYQRRLGKDTQFRLASTAAKYYERERLRPDHVMYESYNARDFGGNPYALFRFLLEHDDYRHLHHVIAVDDLSNAKVAPYLTHPRVTVVAVHSDEYIRYAECCRFFINNASFKPYLIKRPDQIYFTTWHSTLLKKLSKDTGRPWEAVNVARALVTSDIHLSPNPYTTEHLFRSHGVDGMMRGRVYEMGYPRNDLTVNADRAKLRARLGVDDEQRIAVYAPTWRGDYQPEDTAAETLEYANQIRSRLPDGYILFVKFHTLVYRYLDESDVEGVVPRSIDTNELLGVTDLLITDFSGIFFDFLVTGNPILYFTPDRESYSASKNGFYLDLESLPGPLCDDIDALGDSMSRLDDVQSEHAGKYADFVRRFVGNDDGKACERAARVLFGGEALDEYLSEAPGAWPDDTKQDLLFYPANLAGNGVTESFIALTNQIDHAKYNVVVLLPSTTKYRESQQRLHPETKIFYQAAPDGYLQDEYCQERALVAYGADSVSDVPSAAFARTIRRIFGSYTFAAAINYNGYFPNAAAKIATGVQARRKIVYLHNDLEVDRTIKHPQLLSVFSLYQLYDRVVCVSADSLTDNITGAARRAQYVFGQDPTSSMTYSRNAIVPDQIRRRGEAGSIRTVDGEPFLILRNPGAAVVSGLRFDPDKKNLVCVGRLSPEKNHDRLLRAFREVVDQHDDAMLYVVGTGKLLTKLEATASSLGLRNHVMFTGFLPNPLALVARCDCFVMSSDIEGQPITVLEALVLQVPVIATNIAGPRGLLADELGTLVEPSAEALAAAICARLADQPPTHQSFDAEAYVDTVLDEFEAKLI